MFNNEMNGFSYTIKTKNTIQNLLLMVWCTVVCIIYNRDCKTGNVYSFYSYELFLLYMYHKPVEEFVQNTGAVIVLSRLMFSDVDWQAKCIAIHYEISLYLVCVPRSFSIIDFFKCFRLPRYST